MFVSFCRNAFFLIFILIVAGCSASSDVDGGFDPGETIFFDDEYSSELSIEKGEVFALDVPVPKEKGYKLVGASFDPGMLRLEHYLEYDDEGILRARYIFTAVGKGVSDVLIKMEPIAGGDIDVYRMVAVTVGEGGGSLFSF